MATLSIEQASALSADPKENAMPLFPEPHIGHQIVTYSTATQSAAFGSRTNIVRLYSDTACRIEFGGNPTATATSPPYAASTEYFRAVTPGDKLSVVAA